MGSSRKKQKSKADRHSHIHIPLLSHAIFETPCDPSLGFVVYNLVNS